MKALEMMDLVETVVEDGARDVEGLDNEVLYGEADAGMDEVAVGEEEGKLQVRRDATTT